MTHKTPKYKAVVFDEDGVLIADKPGDNGLAYPDMNKLARKLKDAGVVVGVISNGFGLSQRGKLDTCELDEFLNLEHFYVSYDVGEEDYYGGADRGYFLSKFVENKKFENAKDKYKSRMKTKHRGNLNKFKELKKDFCRYDAQMMNFVNEKVEKPSTYMFDKFIKESGLSPSEVLYVGDQTKTDVKGAIKAGFDVYYVAREDTGSEFKYGVKKSNYFNTYRDTLAKDIGSVVLGKKDSKMKKALSKLSTCVF